MTATSTDEGYWRRLFHRWFVEYNPLYLLSAGLVLSGMILLSRGLAGSGSLLGQLGVAAIAEVYALVLIAGAGLLTRIGWRRPAVMLAFLTVIYQCDLTLHTETCPHLGAAGAWAAVAWLALFFVKLRALAWAMKIRIATSALAVAMLGAAGLAVFPFVLWQVDPRVGIAILVGWLSVLVFSYRPQAVTSLVDLDPWGVTVLRRTVRVAWLALGSLLFLHVVFLSMSRPNAIVTLGILLPILSTRWVRSEVRVWLVATAMLGFAALNHPASFAPLALAVAIALAWRAVTAARMPTLSVAWRTANETPYRASADGSAAAVATQPPMPIVPGGHEAMLRLATGSLFALYLALWTLRWSAGPWPAHVLVLDLVFGVVALGAIAKIRVGVPLAPLVATCAHYVVQTRVVSPPSSVLEWGATAVSLGFVLLLGSLAVSYRFRASVQR